MKKRKKSGPPRFVLAFFRWYCHPEFHEEIEGDLVEQFERRLPKIGYRRASWLLAMEVLLLWRPSISRGFQGSLNQLFVMNTKHWLNLTCIILVLVVLAILPAMPGPATSLSSWFNLLARSTGSFGLLFIPVGAIWFVAEIRNSKELARIGGRGSTDRSQNNWQNGYNFAILAAGVGFIFSWLTLFMLIHEEGLMGTVIALVIFGTLWWTILPHVKKLRSSPHTTFNPAPLYLLTIPAAVFAVLLYAIGPLCDLSRNRAITNSQSIVDSIERYKATEGRYPDSLEQLSKSYLSNIPEPGAIGIREFQYEKTSEAYNLYFVQWQHFGTTKEIVMYNKNDRHNVKGHFAYFEAGSPHWKYYWLD